MRFHALTHTSTDSLKIFDCMWILNQLFHRLSARTLGEIQRSIIEQSLYTEIQLNHLLLENSKSQTRNKCNKSTSSSTMIKNNEDRTSAAPTSAGKHKTNAQSSFKKPKSHPPQKKKEKKVKKKKKKSSQSWKSCRYILQLPSVIYSSNSQTWDG